MIKRQSSFLYIFFTFLLFQSPQRVIGTGLPLISRNCVNANTKSSDMGNLHDTYTNPILGGDYPDPTIVRDGKDYYMTHSAFNYVPGLTIFHSSDLVNWKPVSFALTEYLGSVWAPDICKYEGKYYIYFTVSQGNDNFSNYVVYADRPEGPWSSPVDLHVGNWIDPCHVVDESTSQRWLFLSGGHRIRLADDGLSVIGKLEKIYDGWNIPEDWTIEGMALEGPKVKKIGQYYYYLNAQGGTAGAPTSHMAVVARSKSVDGPWENCPDNPLIHTYSGDERWWSKGHASLIDTPDGHWWTVYHAYEKGFLSYGRQTLLEPVRLTDNGWIEAPLGNKIEYPVNSPVSISNGYDKSPLLSEFRIGLDWKFYKDYDPKRIEFKDGTLLMRGKGSNPAESSPILFVTGDHSYEFSVRIECDGNSTGGLILYYNDKFYIGHGCNSKDRYKWRRGEFRGKCWPDAKGPLWLKLRCENNVVTGYYSTDGLNWKKESFGMEMSGYNHNTLGDFQSVLPGLFAYGNGDVRFSNFKYQTLSK